MPPKGYLERLREICDRHGILLVFDEVICGFGRCGAPFAAQAFGVTPDVITVAKAITNGNAPMSAVIVKDEIYDTIVERAPGEGIEFFHGYTWSAHPIACAAASAALAIYRNDRLFERAKSLSPYFLDQVAALRSLPVVTDTRGYGLLAAVDLKPGPAPGERGFSVLRRCFETGAVVRVTMDTIILAPPFVCEQGDIDTIIGLLRDALKAESR